jgi:predicted DsbA family dithiol-disulfide isomerase
MKVTYYLDVISSWCLWAEPAWEDLKQRFAGQVEFAWKIALCDASGLPATAAEEAWYYRRSGTVMRSPFMLNTGWFEPERREYLAPNLVAEAAKHFGVTDDRVRLALARAAMIDGRKVGVWKEAVAVGSQAAGVDPAALEGVARSEECEARVRASTAEFHSFQVNQRPAFLLEDAIGDRAIFSGLVVAAPLAATIEAMLNDTAAYASYAAHHGSPPKG